MTKVPRVLCKAVTLAVLTLGTALAQVNVVTNGGFESGLTGWTAAPSAGNGISTTCSFNASSAGGTETQTGISSLPPESGVGLAMGSIKNTGTGAGAANSSCVLYQDVAIPAGATTATLTVQWGLIRVGTVSLSQAALLARLYSSTATVPYYLTNGVGNITFFQPASSNTTLVPATSGSFDVSSLAGTTARLALFIAMTAGADTGRATVGGFDSVNLSVLVAPSISQSFGAASVPLNGTTSLSYTITNPVASGTTATGVEFTNTLPAGLIVATPNGLTGSCGGGTITAAAGGGTVSLSGGTLTAGSSCTFGVNVTGTTAGTKVNSVTVSASSGTGASSASLQVLGPPTVISVNPSSGALAGGNAVTITGTNFTGATAVTFGGIAATNISVVNSTTITATVPAGAAPGAVSVVVTTPSGSNAPNTLYQYATPAPTITSVTPGSGPLAGGNAVTVTGTYLTGATALTFGGVAATNFSVVDATTITATVPAGSAPGAVSVIVTTPNGSNAPNALYQYTTPAPTITSVTPGSGPLAGGNSVTVTGTYLTGASALTFGGVAATNFSVVDATTITATVPAGSAPGAVSVIVTTPNGSNAPNALYQYTAPVPTITSVTPGSGPLTGGNAVTVTGTNLTGATALTFGGVAATNFSVVNATTIVATVPAGAALGVVSVIVTTPGGSNAPNALYQYVIPPPTITSVVPDSGPQAGGNLVTITGTSFTGATAVTFGSKPATNFAVINATTITAIVPVGNALGAVNVGVVTPNGASAANTLYQYVVPIPTLSEWGMIGLTALLLLYGYRRLQRGRGLPGTP